MNWHTVGQTGQDIDSSLGLLLSHCAVLDKSFGVLFILSPPSSCPKASADFLFFLLFTILLCCMWVEPCVWLADGAQGPCPRPVSDSVQICCRKGLVNRLHTTQGLKEWTRLSVLGCLLDPIFISWSMMPWWASVMLSCHCPRCPHMHRAGSARRHQVSGVQGWPPSCSRGHQWRAPGPALSPGWLPSLPSLV